MKAKQLILSAAMALAAGGAAAKGDPTTACINSLAADPGLKVLADKVALARSAQGALIRVADRAANESERAALAVWLEKRNACFEAGVAHRKAGAKPQELAFVRSVFVFQQR